MFPTFPTSPTSVTTVAQIIQLAVAPVFLLAGIGAFLNVCAGRLSRIVDRARQIEPLLLASRGGEHDRWLREIRVLDRRMALVSQAIFLSVLAAVLICAVVVLLFAAGLTDAELSRLASLVGLDLGGRTPEETAVSIAAEIIARRWGGTGQPLSRRAGRIHQATV